MATGRKKLLMATIVWGDWHVMALVDFTLPSLLAPNNFPCLAQQCDLECLIITRPADHPRIETSRAVQAARRIMAVHVLPALPDVIDASINIFNFHHSMWSVAHERAQAMGAYVLNLAPDAVFADGAGASWSAMLQQGVTSVLWMFPRALDTAMPALDAQYRNQEGAIVVPPRDLVRLNLRHMHPLSLAYYADSPNFPAFHPEMIIWPVGDEGLLMRGFAGEARLFDPRQAELTPQKIVTGNLDRCRFIDDSDILYMMSLTPPAHNAEWYRQTGRADAGQVGRWWMNFDGASNDLVASHQIRIHTGPRTEALWRGRELAANLFVSRATASREFFRLAEAAAAARCSWTATLLRAVGLTRGALRAFPRPMRAIVFGPTDAAIGRLRIEDLLNPSAGPRLIRLLRSHVVADDRPGVTLGQRLDEAGGVLRLRSTAGKELTIRAAGGGAATVDGVRVDGDMFQVCGHSFIPLQGILDAEIATSLN